MATFAELRTASEDSTFRMKVRVATTIKAAAILTETAGTSLANRQKWAGAVLRNPDSAGDSLLWGVLAINAAATLAAIVGASDATVQTAVNTVGDVLANYGV